MPEEWRSVLVPISKNKGEKESCSNHSGTKLIIQWTAHQRGDEESAENIWVGEHKRQRDLSEKAGSKSEREG